MKQKLLLFGTAIALLTACSTEDELAVQEEPVAITNNSEEEKEELLGDLFVADSDVPILFDIDNTTRGSVSSDPFTTDSVGVFCLSRKAIEGTSPKADWGQTGSATANQLRIWKKNVRAKIIKQEGDEYSKLRWDDGKDEHFYPSTDVSLKYAYTFVGYHPYSDLISYSPTALSAEFNIDGNDDVITAVTEIPDEAAENGFSAFYYKNGGTKLPHFQFKHRLSKLNFSARLKEGTSGLFVVDSIWIEEIPSTIKVDLASLDKTSGVVTEESSLVIATSTLSTFWLRENDDTSIRNTQYELTNTLQPIGDCILIPPINTSSFTGTDERKLERYNKYSTLKIFIRLKDADNQIYDLKTTVAPPENGWKQGKKYPINIEVNPTTPTNFEMIATARLGDWESDAEADWNSINYQAQ